METLLKTYRPLILKNAIVAEEFDEDSGCIRFYQEKGCVLIVTRVEAVTEQGLRERKITMTQVVSHTRNTREICRRCYAVGEVRIWLLEQTGFP